MWNWKRWKWKWKEVEDWTKRRDSKAHGRAKIVYINGLPSFTLASHTQTNLTSSSSFLFSLSTIPLFFSTFHHSYTQNRTKQNKGLYHFHSFFFSFFHCYFILIIILNHFYVLSLLLTDPFGFRKLFSLFSPVSSVFLCFFVFLFSIFGSHKHLFWWVHHVFLTPF